MFLKSEELVKHIVDKDNQDEVTIDKDNQDEVTIDRSKTNA